MQKCNAKHGNVTVFNVEAIFLQVFFSIFMKDKLHQYFVREPLFRITVNEILNEVFECCHNTF